MRETRTEDEIIADYLDAYKRANGREAPFEIICIHEAFWFEGKPDSAGRISRQELMELTQNLQQAVERQARILGALPMSEAPKTVWVTEYALECGIEDCRVAHVCDDGSVALEECYAPASAEHCHPTREAAVARANEMKVAKIASLKRQIERLESLEF